MSFSINNVSRNSSPSDIIKPQFRSNITILLSNHTSVPLALPLSFMNLLTLFPHPTIIASTNGSPST